MASITVLDAPDAGDDGSSSTQPSQPSPSSFIYLALYDCLTDDDVDVTTVDDEWLSQQLSWRLIPSESATIPMGGHEIFGIRRDSHSEITSDNEYDEDPTAAIRAFIRMPVKPKKSFESLVNKVQECSETFLNEAIDDGWQEWEWVYNVCEHLEVLEFLDDRVTNTWQYMDKSKMEIFKERVVGLAKQVCKADVPEDRVIDFPLGP
jgi:hypothetical protein